MWHFHNFHFHKTCLSSFAEINYPGKHLKCFLTNHSSKQTATVNKISVCYPECCLSGTKLCLFNEHSCLLAPLSTAKSGSMRTSLPELYASGISQKTKYISQYRYFHVQFTLSVESPSQGFIRAVFLLPWKQGHPEPLAHTADPIYCVSRALKPAQDPRTESVCWCSGGR